MKWKRESEFPCKICPHEKRVIGTVGLHQHLCFPCWVVFIQREVVVQEIMFFILGNLMQRRPRSLLIATLKQGIYPSRIKGFGCTVPAAGSFPYFAISRRLFLLRNRELKVTKFFSANNQRSFIVSGLTSLKIVDSPARQFIAGFTFNRL